MEPAALLKPSGKNVASVNHFCDEKKILLEPDMIQAMARLKNPAQKMQPRGIEPRPIGSVRLVLTS